MVERTSLLGFDLEAPHLVSRGQLAGKNHLEGYHSAKGFFARSKDHPHSALAKLLQQLVITKILLPRTGQSPIGRPR
jgi:hypothetical protein